MTSTMDPLSAIILGVVQALTEFLPVSSSGHLVLGRSVLGLSLGNGAAFEVAVHFGTLLSVLVVLREDVLRLMRSALAVVSAPGRARARWRDDAATREIVAIAVGCVPAGVVGLAFKDELEQAFGSPHLVCGALIVTGVWLGLTHWVRPGAGEVTPVRAALIGLAQAVAIIPGISRSGSTIAAAIFLKVDRAAAARFSFLMSVPVIAGASLLKAREMMVNPPQNSEILAFALGGAVSFVVGMFALWFLLRLVERGRLSWFAPYCLAVGVIGLALL